MGIRIEHGEPVLLLREKDNDRGLSIKVSAAEAVSLIYSQNGVAPNYEKTDDPNYMLPHSLVCDTLREVGIQLISAGITGLKNGIFLAELTLSNGQTVSASPSDSVSLSLRAGAPFLVSAKVLDRAGVHIPNEHRNAAPDNAADSHEQVKPAAPASGQLGLPPPPLSAMRQVVIEGVRVETQTNKPVALLKEKQGDRYLPIRVSASEAAAIASSMEHATPGPPFTHDLFCDVLKAVHVQLLTVSIAKSGDQAHSCHLGLSGGAWVKAKAGDSLAFAVRAGAAVLVTAEFLDEAGMTAAGDAAQT